MFEFLMGFDILGVGAVLGGVALLGWLLWVILDDRDLEELNHRHREDRRKTAPRPSVTASSAPQGASGDAPIRPDRPGRAA